MKKNLTRGSLAIILAGTMMISSLEQTSLYAASSVSTTNPYAYSLSLNNRTALTTWVATKIVTRKDAMSSAAYLNFVNRVLVKINNIKSVTTNSKNLAILNYLGYELGNIITQTANDSSSLDTITVGDTSTHMNTSPSNTSWGVDAEYPSTLSFAQTKAMYARILELITNPPENLVWENSYDLGAYAVYTEDIIGSQVRGESTNGVAITIEYRKKSTISVNSVYVVETKSSKDLVQKWRIWIPKGVTVSSYQNQPARFEATAFAWNKHPVYTKNASTAELDVLAMPEMTPASNNGTTYHGFQCFDSHSCGSAGDGMALVYGPDSGGDFKFSGVGVSIPASGWLYRDRISDPRVVNLGKRSDGAWDQTGPTLGVQNRSSVIMMGISKDNLVDNTISGVVQNIINELNSMN